jgi:hypothetical protein
VISITWHSDEPPVIPRPPGPIDRIGSCDVVVRVLFERDLLAEAGEDLTDLESLGLADLAQDSSSLGRD